MPKRSAGLQAVARFASSLHSRRVVDAHALYWAVDHQRFAAASLDGQRLWEVEVEDGGRLVDVFDGHPVVLTSRLDPPFELALVFLDAASGRVVRRVPAPEDTVEVARCDGVLAFLTASRRFGPADRLVLADAATGERRTIAECEHAEQLRAIAGGFVCALDHVFHAYDRSGRSLWKTDRVLVASQHALLAVGTGGELARLRPQDGAPIWRYAMKGAPKRGWIHVSASADTVAVLEPMLGELALLDRETGVQRWRSKRVAGPHHAPPLIARDAVVALSTATAGGDWPALAAFALADGSPRGVLATDDGFDLTDGLVMGEVCVLAEPGGEALHLVRVPADLPASSTLRPPTAPVKPSTAKASATSKSDSKRRISKTSAEKTTAKKTRASRQEAATSAERAARSKPATGRKTAAVKRT